MPGAKIISIDFNLEILRITNTLLLAGFYKKFMNDTITFLFSLYKIPERSSNECKFFIMQKLILKMTNANSL